MIPCIWYISHVHNWRMKWQPTPVILPRESCGRRSLVSCCPKGHTELDMTEATQHACMHWIRKWQPTPVVLPAEFQGQRTLVGSLYGDAQSQTRLKWLSSNNSMFTTRKKTEQALKNQQFFLGQSEYWSHMTGSHMTEAQEEKPTTGGSTLQQHSCN